MKPSTLWQNLKTHLNSQWIACRAISDRRSIQYGIRFSYPLYMAIVFWGVINQNPAILAIAAVIALLGMKLPLHPFDYVYNYTIAKLIGTPIPGRGSELQVNSTIALIFNLSAIALILFKAPISFLALAIIYIASSTFFLVIFLVNNNSKLAK